MAFDTPATIAVLGAGPVGLEAALYARFLGYQVRIYEQGVVAEHVRRWGHVRMFTPFSMNCSTLGRAALAAQDESYRAPADDACLTGQEWIDQYLLPLSQTDLLSDETSPGTTVLAVSRWGASKGECVGSEARADTPFRILIQDSQGKEREDSADIVIDTTGVYGKPKWLGPSGAPAVGERALRAQIQYHLPDVHGVDQGRYANGRTLLVGNGYSAATLAVAWNSLHAAHNQTELVWVTRRPSGSADADESDSGRGPIPRIPDDQLPRRDELARQANELISQAPGWLRHWSGCQVRKLERNENGWIVGLWDPKDERGWDENCDEIVAMVGYRGDWSPLSELHVHLCYATEGPMKLAAPFLQCPSAASLNQGDRTADALLTPEPDFYVLGAKSYGRNSHFLFSEGLRQIRDLFSIIGDRADLDLYAGARSLPR
jgi:hypothetical protein